MQTTGEFPIHQAIACALIATPALAYNTTQGHVKEDCPSMHSEVCAYMNRQAAARGRGRGKDRGIGHGRPAVAAISTADVPHIVEGLPGETSAFLPDQW